MKRFSGILMVHIIIPVHNGLQETTTCLQALRQQTHKDFKVYVVDDGSTDGTAEALARDYPEVQVIQGSGDLWWTGAMQLGVDWVLGNAVGSGDYIMSLNNDVILAEDCLEKLNRFIKEHARAIVSGLSVDGADRDTVISSGSRMVSWVLNIAHHPFHGRSYKKIDKKPVPVDMIAGRCTLFPVHLVREIGNYDAKHFPHYGGDNEFTWRAKRKGWKLYILPEAVAFVSKKRTGLNPMSRRLSLQEMAHSFVSIKSVNNLAMRARFAWFCCPWYALPTYTMVMCGKILIQTVIGNILAGKGSNR